MFPLCKFVIQSERIKLVQMILNPDNDIFKIVPNAPLQQYFRETQQFPCNHTTFTFRHILNDLKEAIIENELFDFFNPYYIVCDEDLSIALGGYQRLHVSLVRTVVRRQLIHVPQHRRQG